MMNAEHTTWIEPLPDTLKRFRNCQFAAETERDAYSDTPAFDDAWFEHLSGRERAAYEAGRAAAYAHAASCITRAANHQAAERRKTS